MAGLFALGLYLHGFIHIGDSLFAGVAVALVAVFKVFQVGLKDFDAKSGQAFLAGIVQGGFGFQLGGGVGVFAKLFDGGIGGPVGAVLALALFIEGVDEEIVGSQDEDDGRNPQNHEPLEHDAERTASRKFVLGDYSLWQTARDGREAPTIQEGGPTAKNWLLHRQEKAVASACARGMETAHCERPQVRKAGMKKIQRALRKRTSYLRTVGLNQISK
jgi:hypothetical protein